MDLDFKNWIKALSLVLTMKKLGSLSLPSENSIGELSVRNRQLEITDQDFRLLFVDQVVRKKYQVFCKNRKYERGLMENFLAANFWQYIYLRNHFLQYGLLTEN